MPALSGSASWVERGGCARRSVLYNASPADILLEGPGIALVPVVGHEDEREPLPSRTVEAHRDRKLPLLAAERLCDHANAALARRQAKARAVHVFRRLDNGDHVAGGGAKHDGEGGRSTDDEARWRHYGHDHRRSRLLPGRSPRDGDEGEPRETEDPTRAQTIPRRVPSPSWDSAARMLA